MSGYSPNLIIDPTTTTLYYIVISSSTSYLRSFTLTLTGCVPSAGLVTFTDTCPSPSQPLLPAPSLSTHPVVSPALNLCPTPIQAYAQQISYTYRSAYDVNFNAVTSALSLNSPTAVCWDSTLTFIYTGKSPNTITRYTSAGVADSSYGKDASIIPPSPLVLVSVLSVFSMLLVNMSIIPFLNLVGVTW